MQRKPPTGPQNHYSVLGLTLTRDGQQNTSFAEELKAAYHRSLLLHHPDKAASTSISARNGDKPQAPVVRYTVDQIILAHETLSDPVAKAIYDKTLFARRNTPSALRGDSAQCSHVGVETFDLDDLVYHEAAGTWSKSCRCGNEEGFVVTESDLETASAEAEVVVQCRGCSLCIKVTFDVQLENGQQEASR